ncbi:adenylate/guanylate cyclase domain-containing protein [Mycobacterium sp. GA-1841]|uniref:adenylate/guanylate cyclase domain-containing protein n=1 Tax=Mycobacterium sp. GA-1841 TaxID=1834154 RepID=UPI001115596D|nr:adenylate/guanylate cyclase domain-containing protein [Mycobacterium sp. GA-1841]
MVAALPYFRATVVHVVALHDGVLSARRAACDSFVATFDRPADAVSCALQLQLAPLDPFDLCIGIHSIRTGARCLRDIAHGGQTLVSGATAVSADELPSGAGLKHLGDHRMDNAAHQILQLRHPGLRRYLPSVPKPVLAEVLTN